MGALVLIGTLVWAFSPRPLEVETDILTRGRFERSVEDDGWTRLRDRYIVSAPLSGELSRLSLREGDVVEQGDVIALLSPVSPSLLDEREVQIQRERIRVLQAQSLAAETEIGRAHV